MSGGSSSAFRKMNNHNKEVIHVALGDMSCMISTHLHHIQGLSCTKTDDDVVSTTTTTAAAAATATTMCTPTHTTFQNVHVPRSVLVGNIYSNQQYYNDTPTSTSSNNDIISNTTTAGTFNVPTWSGTIETLAADRMFLSTERVGESIHHTTALFGGNNSYNSNNTNSSRHHMNSNESTDLATLQQQQQQQQQQQLARMNYGPYSRYHVDSMNHNNYNYNSTRNTSKNTYQSTIMNQRHVNWDEEEDMRDHDDEEEEDENDIRVQQQQEQHWKKEYHVAQQAMDDYWKLHYHNHPNDTHTTTTDVTTTPPMVNRTQDNHNHPIPTTPNSMNQETALTWYDYLHLSTMPFHPTNTLVNEQFSPLVVQQQQVMMMMDQNLEHTTAMTTTYYHALHEDTNFVETILWEQHIRSLLEQCDSCQGIMLLQDHITNTNCSSSNRNNNTTNGIYTGWGTNLLQFWNDECPHTVQFSIPVSDCNNNNNNNNNNNVKVEQRNERQSFQQRQAVRDDIQQSLLLSDQTLLSTVVLPLQLPTSSSSSSSTYSTNPVAVAAAAVAMAMECSTLPFRIVDGSSNSRSSSHHHVSAHLELQSFYSSNSSYHGNSEGIPNLSYREFVRTLQRQSTSRNVLELDTTLPWNANNSSTNKSMLDTIQQGTSIERDHRMKQSGYQGGIHRPADVLPGDWLNTQNNSSILSSLSPQLTNTTAHNTNDTKQNAYDRNLHYHYALSTSVRPPSSNSRSNNNRQSSEPKPKISNYVTSIMESMGVRYRPEQSLCTVLDQSYEDLLHTNGSYWKYIFRGCTTTSSSAIPYGNMSVLGNTTRIYPYLVRTASNAQQIISPRNKKSIQRSIYNRDITMGMVPEMDDLNEAVTTCLDIRDSYEPPHGSGLIVDEEGEYFDMS